MKKKDRTNNVLPFPKATRPAAQQDPPPSTAFFQVGSTRFAIHMWCELLPPAPLRGMPRVTNTATDTVTLSADCERSRSTARSKTPTNLRVGRISKPSLVKAIPIQPNRATEARVQVPDAKE